MWGVDFLPGMEGREVNGNPDGLRAFRAEGRSVSGQEISLEVSKTPSQDYCVSVKILCLNRYSRSRGRSYDTLFVDSLPDTRQLDGHKELQCGEERMRNDHASGGYIVYGRRGIKTISESRYAGPPTPDALSCFKIPGVHPLLQSGCGVPGLNGKPPNPAHFLIYAQFCLCHILTAADSVLRCFYRLWLLLPFVTAG